MSKHVDDLTKLMARVAIIRLHCDKSITRRELTLLECQIRDMIIAAEAKQ